MIGEARPLYPEAAAISIAFLVRKGLICHWVNRRIPSSKDRPRCVRLTVVGDERRSINHTIRAFTQACVRVCANSVKRVSAVSLTQLE